MLPYLQNSVATKRYLRLRRGMLAGQPNVYRPNPASPDLKKMRILALAP